MSDQPLIRQYVYAVEERGYHIFLLRVWDTGFMSLDDIGSLKQKEEAQEFCGLKNRPAL